MTTDMTDKRAIVRYEPYDNVIMTSKIPTITGVTISVVRRLNNSVNGNPRYVIWLENEDGSVSFSAQTMSDASCSYDVENYSRSHKLADITLTAAGKVRTISPHKDTETVAMTFGPVTVYVPASNVVWDSEGWH
jgi:hypothetical protein